MSLTKRWLDELNEEREARGECLHGLTGPCDDCASEHFAYEAMEAYDAAVAAGEITPAEPMTDLF
jgi:hypothetical protein